ncbi:MAG: HAD family hydrolase [Dongiaceae bacterium]
MMKVRGVLFDKDGTLFDFYRTWGPVTEAAALAVANGDQSKAQYILVNSGKDPETGRYRPGSPIASGSNQEIAQLWADLLGRSDKAGDIYRQMETMFLENQKQGAVPVLDLPLFFGRLRERGLKLGVATMDSELGALTAMDRYNARDCLDFICGFDTGHGVKPGGGMVQAFAQRMGLATGEIAVVGDSPHDIEMAHAGGAGRAIGVLTGVSPREALLACGAHIVIDSIAELEAII